MPEIGDIIQVNKFGYQHVGVFVGPRGADSRCVVHNCKGNGVVLSHFQDFANGSPVFIHQKANGNYFQREEIARKALALLGKKYDLLTFNCEHAANLAQNGKAESPQIKVLVVLMLVLGSIAFLSGNKS